MKIDLLHNNIVAETITPAFEASVTDNLLPLLYEIYSKDEIVGIQMYEDYIADNFSFGGYWYYPLTVITNSGYDTVWIKWAINTGDFEDGVPYSYVGEGGIKFLLASNTPDEFAHALEGRSLHCEDGLIKVSVKTGTDVVKLSGKYSQTFLDELARQITPAIEQAASVEGIAGSPIELVMTFAQNTYLDHISDNVTYRRLIMIDGASAPRDFWVKWTRLDGVVAYHSSEHVWGDHIFFELGEDVAQKIIEKEYRYLLTSTEKYHSAMSRSNVTAWRDLIKRAVKHGEITKIEREIELDPETLALEAELANVLGRAGISTSESKDEPVATNDFDGDDEFSRAMRKAREVAEGSSNYEAAPEPEWIEDSEPEVVEDDEPEVFEIDEPEAVDEEEPEVVEEEPEAVEEEPEAVEEETEAVEEEPEVVEEAEETEEIIEDFEEDDMLTEETKPTDTIDEEEAAALDELTKLALEALAYAKERAMAAKKEPEKEPEKEMEFEILPIPEEVAEEIGAEPEPAKEEEPVEEIAPEVVEEEQVEEIVPEVVEEEVVEEVAEEISEPIVIDEESIRAELEAKIRLEYENRARIKAEEEISKLRREQEQLRLENEAIVARAEREKEILRAEYEKLKEKARREALASEAREAVRRAEEEKLRAQIENRLRHEARERERLAEAARMAIEEQRRLEAEAARAAFLREEEERMRIENERRAAEEARLEEMKQAEIERIRREEEERQKAIREAMPEMGDGQYTYTNRNVRLIFRRSVDPNITTRIQEIMKASIEYYGKEKIYLKIRASIPDSQTVCLEFIHIPMEEMELLGNIIKILGNSGLGIAKAIVE